jgi:hypothetical protein
MKYLGFAHYLVSKFRFGLFNVFFFIPKKSDGIKQSMEDNDKRYFLNILGVVNLFYNYILLFQVRVLQTNWLPL